VPYSEPYARLSSVSTLPDNGSSAGAASVRGAIDTGIRGRCCASTLPARAKNLAAPLVQLIGINPMRLREAGNGVARLAGLFDPLAI
jgi:hypothetical protein